MLNGISNSLGMGGFYENNYLERGRNNQSKTVNTDQVDREIKMLKEEKKQLEQKIKMMADDEKKVKDLQMKLAQVEGELLQKDNDAYRRQHAVVS